jgi:threonylcarbamoyladenosine tRNA methylthiotransferase MtaB
MRVGIHPHFFSIPWRLRLKGNSIGMKPTFSITTLGCKLNQYESECIRQALVNRDWQFKSFGEKAEYYIINTCTVTGKTDARCRNAVRRAKKASPDSKVIVTGCYAETQPESLKMMPETDLVIGNDGKNSIISILEELAGANDEISVSEKIESFEITEFHEHARAFIKVQEGCDSSCTYCIIPRARGRSRSVPEEQVGQQVRKLEVSGIEEIVLTGTHIGRYGMDLSADITLDRLIRNILDRTDKLRIRLSSIEVNEVSDEIIDLIIETERLAPHLHIPLQSGDDQILMAMNRPYNTSFFRNRIESIRCRSDGIGLGTDIITGFPGEDEASFSRTIAYMKSLPLTYFHVFAFSRRPDTPAASMDGQVDPVARKRRSRKLIDLGKFKKREFMRSLAGRAELAVIQGKAKRYSKFSTALTGSYCEVSVDSPSSLIGKLARVDITHYSRGRLYGRLR